MSTPSSEMTSTKRLSTSVPNTKRSIWTISLYFLEQLYLLQLRWALFFLAHRHSSRPTLGVAEKHAIEDSPCFSLDVSSRR
jgi:hypothetical protein